MAQRYISSRLLGGLVVLYKRNGKFCTSRLVTSQFWLQQLQLLNPQKYEVLQTARQIKAQKIRENKKKNGIPLLEEKDRKKEAEDQFYIDKKESLIFKTFLQNNNWRLPTTGHLGTLDPFASGALVTLYGHAVRLQGIVQSSPKKYNCVLKIGEKTESGDLETSVIERGPADWKMPSIEVLQKLIDDKLIGDVMLKLPLYGATRVDGERRHRMIRRESKKIRNEGEEKGWTEQEVLNCIREYHELNENTERSMKIIQCKATIVDDSRIKLDVTCGKGTYIRSLGQKLAELLGTVGHLVSLGRLAENVYGVNNPSGCAFKHYQVNSVLRTCSEPILMRVRPEILNTARNDPNIDEKHFISFLIEFRDLVLNKMMNGLDSRKLFRNMGNTAEVMIGYPKSTDQERISVEQELQGENEEMEVTEKIQNEHLIGFYDEYHFEPLNFNMLKPGTLYTVFLEQPDELIAATRNVEEDSLLEKSEAPSYFDVCDEEADKFLPLLTFRLIPNDETEADSKWGKPEHQRLGGFRSNRYPLPAFTQQSVINWASKLYLETSKEIPLLPITKM